jgi:hypothetical protein
MCWHGQPGNGPWLVCLFTWTCIFYMYWSHCYGLLKIISPYLLVICLIFYEPSLNFWYTINISHQICSRPFYMLTQGLVWWRLFLCSRSHGVELFSLSDILYIAIMLILIIENFQDHLSRGCCYTISRNLQFQKANTEKSPCDKVYYMQE